MKLPIIRGKFGFKTATCGECNFLCTIANKSNRSTGKNIGDGDVNFGYQRIDEEQKKEKVHSVFANVANKYDLMNDTMSFFVHRLWKEYYVQKLKINKNSSVLDMAGGTGDIAFRVLDRFNRMPAGDGAITVADINEKMLNTGQHRASERYNSRVRDRLRWVIADAEALSFPDNAFDIYTIAFGIRNCTHLDKVLSEANRVLKPGGTFSCLEFGHVRQPIIKRIYDAYSFQLIPVMGKLLVGDFDSYKYLVESIRMFPDKQKFSSLIMKAGFKDITYEELSCGICNIFTEPLESFEMIRITGNTLVMFNNFALRAFATSNMRGIRFRSQGCQSDVVEIGRLVEDDRISQFERGQLFIHRIFAYRGIILWSKNCKVYKKTDESTQQERVPYYQCLIEQNDWDEMNFDFNLTTCLNSNGNDEQKNKADYNGMDVVAHDEVIPYMPFNGRRINREQANSPPVNNQLFDQFFTLNKSVDNITGHKYSPIETFQKSLPFNSMMPQAVFKQMTGSVEVQVLPFYLGFNVKQGHNIHLWRCLFRIRNLEKARITLKGRHLELSSMSGQHRENGVLKAETRGLQLTPQKSATQFISHFEMSCEKGNNLWGHFIAIDDQNRELKLSIPTIRLEGIHSSELDQMETVE